MTIQTTITFAIETKDLIYFGLLVLGLIVQKGRGIQSFIFLNHPSGVYSRCRRTL